MKGNSFHSTTLFTFLAALLVFTILFLLSQACGKEEENRANMSLFARNHFWLNRLFDQLYFGPFFKHSDMSSKSVLFVPSNTP